MHELALPFANITSLDHTFLCLALHTTHEVEDEVRATFAHEAKGPCMSE